MHRTQTITTVCMRVHLVSICCSFTSSLVCSVVLCDRGRRCRNYSAHSTTFSIDMAKIRQCIHRLFQSVDADIYSWNISFSERCHGLSLTSCPRRFFPCAWTFLATENSNLSCFRPWRAGPRQQARRARKARSTDARRWLAADMLRSRVCA